MNPVGQASIGITVTWRPVAPGVWEAELGDLLMRVEQTGPEHWSYRVERRTLLGPPYVWYAPSPSLAMAKAIETARDLMEAT